MEESLCDLLERLSDVATGAANRHEKPSNIVEEVKDILDHLAEDELPSASAIFLAKVCLSTKNKTRFFPRTRSKKTNAQKKTRSRFRPPLSPPTLCLQSLRRPPAHPHTVIPRRKKRITPPHALTC